MIYDRDLIARLLMRDFIDLPLEIAKKAVSRMSDEDICRDFHLIIRRGIYATNLA